MWFENPLWLLLLILVIPFLFSGRTNDVFSGMLGKIRKLKSINTDKTEGTVKKTRYLTLLRILSVICVILVLAGIYILLPVKKQAIVALFDISESVSFTEKEKARIALIKIIEETDSSDRIAVIAFAGEPSLIIPMSRPDRALNILKSVSLSAPVPGETDITGAITLAREILSRSSGNKRIFLFSDGRPTSGGIIPDNALYKTRIYSIPVGEPSEGLISKELKMPGGIALNEPFSAQWEVYSSIAQIITAEVRVDNISRFKKTYELRKGVNLIPVEITPSDKGSHQIDIKVTSKNYSSHFGDISGIFGVSTKPGILIVFFRVPNKTLTRAFNIQKLAVKEINVKELPSSPGFLNNYSAVILDNVPASFLNNMQQKTLQNYVSGGGGLLAIGGDSSLGRGAYYDSILEEILPVHTDTRQRILYDKTEIIYVIDHSESMSVKSGNMTKYDAALSGVMASLEETDPRNEIGIVTFDSEARWTLPLTSAGRRREIAKSLATVPQGGGTNLGKAFEEVLGRMAGTKPVRRHLIVITDGLTMPGDFKALSRGLKNAGFTITTIGIGKDINENLLREIADWGEGKYYYVQANEIPRVIKDESFRVTRELIREGGFRPVIKTETAWLSDLAPLPVVNGYLVTKPKNLAIINIEIGENDPLLAWWRYGSGKSAVITSDSGRRWLNSWSGTKAYNLLFSQTIRSLSKESADPGLRIRTSVYASKAYLTATAFDNNSNLRTGLLLKGYTSEGFGEVFSFHEKNPGIYEAEIQLNGKGINTFSIVEEGGNARADAWAWNPPGKELYSTGPDISFLSQLSSATGGAMLDAGEINLPDAEWEFAPYSLNRFFLAAALILFLTDLFFRSTSSNQLQAAKKLILKWWQKKDLLIERAYRFSKKREESKNI